MGKLLIGVGALLVAGAGVGAYAWAKAQLPDFGPAGPDRDLAPESLVAYVELSDLGATWTKMQATESWKDLAGSKIAARFLDSGAMKDLVAAVDQVGEKAGYALDAAGTMKFLGRECSVGVALDPKGGGAEALLLTKIDVAALKKDLAARDVAALWEEAQRRTSRCDFVMTRDEWRGYAVAKATRGGTTFHAALLGDTLAVATDAKLLRAAIDCRKDGGEKSLGRRADFRADMAKLPAGATARAWYDLDALDKRRASLDAGLESLGAPRGTRNAVHGLLDGVRGAGAVAQAVSLPAGDLYRATWTWSKGEELLADKAKPALRDLYFGEWIFYGEADGLGAVADAWEKSSLKKKLGDGRFGLSMKEFADDPTKTIQELREWTEARVGTRFRADEDEPPSDAPDAPRADVVDRFAVTMARRLVADRLGAFFGGEAACAVDWTGKPGDAARVACAVRLDVEGRLAALAVSGALLDKKAGVVCDDCGGRKVFTSGSGTSIVHWALVGDALVIGTDRDFVRQAARGGADRPLGPPPKVKDAVAAFKPGRRGFARLDVARLADAVAAAAKTDRSMRSLSSMFEQYRAGDLGVAEYAAAAYVADDFSSVEVKTRARLADVKDDRLREALDAPPHEPRAWATLPETTILHVAQSGAGVETAWLGFKAGFRAAGADLRELENSFRSKMGMDLEKDLLPALGHEFAFAATFRAAAAPTGPGAASPPIPGFLVEIETRDPATVQRALDRAVELAEEALRDESIKKPQKHVVREARGGVEILRLVPPPSAGLPFQPACALIDGSFYAASDVEALHELVDARDGKGRRLADTPAFADATAALGRASAQFALLDWGKLLDQVAVYTPQLADLTFAVKPPVYPDNMDDAEWKRRVAEYDRKVEEAKRTGVETTKAWIDALRVVDWIGVSATRTEKAMETTTVVKFAK